MDYLSTKVEDIKFNYKRDAELFLKYSKNVLKWAFVPVSDGTDFKFNWFIDNGKYVLVEVSEDFDGSVYSITCTGSDDFYLYEGNLSLEFVTSLYDRITKKDSVSIEYLKNLGLEDIERF
jgi:hypothetical protein